MESRRLELNFLRAELRDICEIRAVALEKLGPMVAVQLAIRLADAEAVDTADEFFGLYPDEAIAVGTDDFNLEFTSNATLALRAGNVKAPRDENGDIDWSRVDRLLVTAIEVKNG